MHKVYLNVAPVNICKIFNRVDKTAPRREPEYFAVPYNRLKSTDKSLNYIGPKLYNQTINAVNKDAKYIVTNLQDKFTNSFKSTVNKYLLDMQAREESEQNWIKANFVLADQHN